MKRKNHWPRGWSDPCYGMAGKFGSQDLANLAAHAVASHAVAKQGAGGASAPAGAGGLEAIFAALLAQASGTAGDATAPEVADHPMPATAASAAKHMAELLNSSAKIPAAGTQAPPHRDPAKQDAANSNAIVAAMATRPAAPPAKPGIADGATQKNPQPGKREAQGATVPPAPDGNKDKDEHAAGATAPAVIVAALAQPVTAQVTPPASRSADQDAAKAADPAGTPAAKAASGPPADPASQRAMAQQALLEAGAAPQGAHPNPHHPATEPQTTGTNPAAPSQAATGAAQDQSLETALAALQAVAQKPVTANAHADTAQPTTKAVTALGKAAFAAAADKAMRQDMPAQRTASALPPSVQTAPWSGGAEPQSGSTGPGNHGSDTQSHNGSAHASSDTPSASPAASQATQAPGQFAQAVHAAAPSADPSAAAQSTAANLQAQAPVTASLHVAPQSAAQAAPGQQGIALSDFGAIAVNIAAQSKDGAKEFNIALHPQDLGSIHVRLSVDHGGAAQAHLSADNPQTLTLLQRDSHLLERALKDAGLNLAGGSLNFSLKGQDRQTGNGAQPNGRSRSLSVTAVANTNGPPAGPASTYNLAPDDVRLDIRV